MPTGLRKKPSLWVWSRLTKASSVLLVCEDGLDRERKTEGYSSSPCLESMSEIAWSIPKSSPTAQPRRFRISYGDVWIPNASCTRMDGKATMAWSMSVTTSISGSTRVSISYSTGCTSTESNPSGVLPNVA